MTAGFRFAMAKSPIKRARAPYYLNCSNAVIVSLKVGRSVAMLGYAALARPLARVQVEGKRQRLIRPF